jgi:hypothetical protein
MDPKLDIVFKMNTMLSNVDENLIDTQIYCLNCYLKRYMIFYYLYMSQAQWYVE